MKIEDGTGKGFAAAVSASNRLDVSSRSNPREYYISRDDGRAFHFSVDYSPGNTASATLLSIRNTSNTRDLYIGEIVCSSNTTTGWGIYLNTGTDTGTTITGVNLNKLSSNSAEADALQAATLGTANTSTGLVAAFFTPAFEGHIVDSKDAIVLGKNDSINVSIANVTLGAAGVTKVTIDGHYEELGDL